MTRFNLSVDVFTRDVRDAVDVAQALRGVADRLAKFPSQPWSPYALEGKIYAEESKRQIGAWRLEPEADLGLTITAANDPDSRAHCPRCGEHVRHPRFADDVCAECDAKEARP